MRLKNLLLCVLIICSCQTAGSRKSVSVEALSSKHIGKIVIIQTDSQGILSVGSTPPNMMITWNEKGNVYTGRLDAIEKDFVTISAFAGVPSDPEYRRPAQIEKSVIKEIRIQNTEQGSGQQPSPKLETYKRDLPPLINSRSRFSKPNSFQNNNPNGLPDTTRQSLITNDL